MWLDQITDHRMFDSEVRLFLGRGLGIKEKLYAGLG